MYIYIYQCSKDTVKMNPYTYIYICIYSIQGHITTVHFLLCHLCVIPLFGKARHILPSETWWWEHAELQHFTNHRSFGLHKWCNTTGGAYNHDISHKGFPKLGMIGPFPFHKGNYFICFCKAFVNWIWYGCRAVGNFPNGEEICEVSPRQIGYPGFLIEVFHDDRNCPKSGSLVRGPLTINSLSLTNMFSLIIIMLCFKDFVIVIALTC